MPVDDESSVFTVLVYLNSPSRGGETRFFSDAGDLLHEVTPAAGRVVCFFHDTLHSSAPVVETKYVIRTEMMFHRVNKAEVDSTSYSLKPEYQKLVSVYAASQGESKPTLFF